MDLDEGIESLASLKQSIQDSEASLRQMKETIAVVRARLKQQSQTAPNGPGAANRKHSYLNAAGGGG